MLEDEIASLPTEEERRREVNLANICTKSHYSVFLGLLFCEAA